jgi:uncharacterized protein YndB with AHSA1/START domain
MADIATQIDIAAPPAAVRAALTTTAGVAGWWTTKNETSGTPGDVNTYWFPGAPSPYEMRVERVDDGAVAWHCVAGPPGWVGTHVRFTVSEAAEGGTLVLFDHTGFPAVDTMYRIVTLGWAQMLLRLKQYAETGAPTPFFTV